MGWIHIGNITVSENWTDINFPLSEVETFKLTHQTTVDPYINSAFLTRYFPYPEPGGIYAPWRRIYPSEQPTIINLPIPAEFKIPGAVVTFLLMARWKFPYYPVPWVISIEGYF